MSARGENSARAAQIATLETRRRKEYGVPAGRLRSEWRARAAEHGLDRFQLRRVLRHRVDRNVDELELVDEVSRDLEGPDGLTREQSRFTLQDVIRPSPRPRRAARVDEIERRATAFLERTEIVALESEGAIRDYTTRSLLHVERELLDGAGARQSTAVAIAEPDAIRAALDARPSLSEEQRDLVLALTRSGDGVQVVLAPAGTGKTFALGAAVDAWRCSGTAVLGCGLSARAACELRDQAGIDATTIARLRRALDEGIELGTGAVLIVDEAGMVGTRDVAVLAEAARRAQAKLVLVGDDRQLPEIKAGGAFAALAHQLRTVELREVRRQRGGLGSRGARGAAHRGRRFVCPRLPRAWADRRHAERGSRTRSDGR